MKDQEEEYLLEEEQDAAKQRFLAADPCHSAIISHQSNINLSWFNNPIFNLMV